jgi:EcsC protein family
LGRKIKRGNNMEKFKLKKINKEDMQQALDNVVDNVIITSGEDIHLYVDKLKEQNPGLNNEELAKKILNRKALKNGLVGAAMGVGGIVALPADIIASWKIQISTALAIAYIYGHTTDTTDLKTDIYLILAGNSAKEALKFIGIEASKGITKKAVQKYITRETMRKIWKVVGQKIITKAGEKSITSFMKMVPLVGAPVGFVFDWSSALTVGKFAMKYYKN